MLAKVCILAGLGLTGLYVAFPRPQDDAILLDEPVSVARTRLEIGRRVVEGTGMGSLTLDHEGSDRGALLIGLTRAGDPARVTCRVTLADADPGRTRARVDCAQPATAVRPAMRRLGERALALIVREHVAATVADRDYDIDRVSGGLVTLVATNKPAIAQSMETDAAPD